MSCAECELDGAVDPGAESPSGIGISISVRGVRGPGQGIGDPRQLAWKGASRIRASARESGCQAAIRTLILRNGNPGFYKVACMIGHERAVGRIGLTTMAADIQIALGNTQSNGATTR